MSELKIKGDHFILHPYGSAFWKERSTLLVADVHLGKAAHFRKNGMAVPTGTMFRAYEKIDTLIRKFNPDTLCFLGDLFHSSPNNEWDLFADWTTHIESDIVLIKGNHDLIPEHRLESLGIHIRDSWDLPPFYLTHEPNEDGDTFNICGHIHPGVRLRGPGRQSLRLPCFFKKEHQLILPAFGEFTGKHVLSPQATDQVYAVTPEEVLLVSG
ncbi:ligase-associated DNA damage response endonuclease PdeM [Robertkochia sediminum]|uniref:ligase-associated DNA damage response endonuclease PdeM n=1 Tax=Robertkochia sediminum TaxID=2785326 RepID=UPI00293D72A8|nr:ligase-associated DNA damage response endonuclease PdeM [Robertkochia sediminum]